MNETSTSYLLDSKLLRCFLAVMEYGSVTVASEVLCLTQSATSKNILKLEEELGIVLFDRSSGGMIPTIYGMTLARHAKLIHVESFNARSEIDVLKRGGYGTLTIGSGPMWSVYLLPEAIHSLLQQRPGVKVHTSSGVIDTLVPQLLKGEVDLICAALDFPDHGEIEKQYLFDVEYIVVARRQHPLCQRADVSVEELLDYPWVGLSNDFAINRRIAQFFTGNGLDVPRTVVEASSLGAILSIAQTGDFLIGVAAPILAHAEQLGFSRVRMNASFWRFQAGVAYRRNHGQYLVDELIQALRAALARR